MKIKDIKSIVIAWKNGIYTPEMALRLLLKQLELEVPNNMATVHDYEAYKQYLHSLNLSSAEYERRLREWSRRSGF